MIMRKQFKNEGEALKFVQDYGAKVVDDLIYPPDYIPFSRFMSENREKFYDAMYYLQIEHDYRNANNVPFDELYD